MESNATKLFASNLRAPPTRSNAKERIYSPRASKAYDGRPNSRPGTPTPTPGRQKIEQATSGQLKYASKSGKEEVRYGKKKFGGFERDTGAEKKTFSVGNGSKETFVVETSRVPGGGRTCVIQHNKQGPITLIPKRASVIPGAVEGKEGLKSSFTVNKARNLKNESVRRRPELLTAAASAPPTPRGVRGEREIKGVRLGVVEKDLGGSDLDGEMLMQGDSNRKFGEEGSCWGIHLASGGEERIGVSRKEELLKLSSIGRVGEEEDLYKIYRRAISPKNKSDMMKIGVMSHSRDFLQDSEFCLGEGGMSRGESFTGRSEEGSGAGGGERGENTGGYSSWTFPITNHSYLPPGDLEGGLRVGSDDFETNRFLSHTSLLEDREISARIVEKLLEDENLLRGIPREQLENMVEKLKVVLTANDSNSRILSKGAILFREGEKLEGNIRITNTSDHPITFRIKPPQRPTANVYKVFPEMGTLNVGRSAIVKIITDYLSAPPMIKYDTFEIQSSEIESGHFSPEELLSLWQNFPKEAVQSTSTHLVLCLHPEDPIFSKVAASRRKCSRKRWGGNSNGSRSSGIKDGDAGGDNNIRRADNDGGGEPLEEGPKATAPILRLLLQESEVFEESRVKKWNRRKGLGEGEKNVVNEAGDERKEKCSEKLCVGFSSPPGHMKLFYLIFSACSLAAGIFLLRHNIANRLKS